MAGALRAPWLWRGPDSACVQWGGSMGSEVAEVVQDDVRLSWTQAGGQGKGDPREEGVACWLVESGPRQARSAGPSSTSNPRCFPLLVPGEPPRSVSVTPRTTSSVLIQWQVRPGEPPGAL